MRIYAAQLKDALTYLFNGRLLNQFLEHDRVNQERLLEQR
jgi:hypothetical protein